MTSSHPERTIITTPEQLADYVKLTEAEKEGIRQCRAIMPMKITRHYAALLERDNPDDPLRKLVIPSLEELVRYPDDAEVDTHKDEAQYQPVEGIIHRYPGKVLLMVTTACFAHCRFCFRSEKVASTLDGRRLDKAIGYIRNDATIRDVIFTGGDPMQVSSERLERALAEVRRIPHVEIIRITTRAPIFAPELFTGEMIAMLSRFKPLILITSFIHPRELSDETCSVLDRLSDAGIVLLQQGPILRGLNDDADTLRTMYEKLARHRTMPYYATWGIVSPGNRHFTLDGESARRLIRQLENTTSGFCIPHLSTLDQNNNKTRTIG
ncbi:KamA family radical SAM protein [Chlorobaculum sp. 24CR]|uniref:KamA family radical SAM protein n=1 Tax=Chlorobaculum sp. 24CR TaxID=2508878 RepID=UPI00100BD706|nr:KamA family radical SAM protein [Chlorobaculum sp. 24CR]RXK88845.1 KamA family radical SAM protein [Chlorobaculum sp. 24CR]